LVVAVPKPPIVDVLDGAPNVKALVVAGVPKLRPVNKDVDVAGVGNKLGAVVIVVATLDPKRPLDCVCVEDGVEPNPKFRPMDVVGVDRVLNVNVLGVVVTVPKDVLPTPKPVPDLKNNNNIIN